MVIVVVDVVSSIYLVYARDICTLNVWQNLDYYFDPTVVYMTEEEEEGFNLICQSLLFLFG